MQRSALILSTCDSSIRSENLPSTGEASVAYAHARAFLEAGRFHDAVAWAHRAVELDPASATCRLLLGVAALRGDQPALALSVLQALAVEHPTPDVLSNLGLALMAHAIHRSLISPARWASPSGCSIASTVAGAG